MHVQSCHQQHILEGFHEESNEAFIPQVSLKPRPDALYFAENEIGHDKEQIEPHQPQRKADIVQEAHRPIVRHFEVQVESLLVGEVVEHFIYELCRDQIHSSDLEHE